MEAQQDGYGGASMISVQVLRHMWLLKLQPTCSPGNTNIYLPHKPGSSSGVFGWAQQGELPGWGLENGPSLACVTPKHRKTKILATIPLEGKNRKTPWFTASSCSWDCKLCSSMWGTSGCCFLTAECVHFKWIQTPSRKKKTKQKRAEDHSKSNTSLCLGAAFIPTGSQRHAQDVAVRQPSLLH